MHQCLLPLATVGTVEAQALKSCPMRDPRVPSFTPGRQFPKLLAILTTTLCKPRALALNMAQIHHLYILNLGDVCLGQHQSWWL